MTSHRAVIFLLHFELILNSVFFFFNDTATTEIYTLSLHDALPISFSLNSSVFELACAARVLGNNVAIAEKLVFIDRKSTRLNSSHGYISYAVFCLKKKKKQINQKDYRRYVAMTRRRHG